MKLNIKINMKKAKRFKANLSHTGLRKFMIDENIFIDLIVIHFL
jgi:hypothetical protein